MIAKLTGLIDSAGEDAMIINVGGVGYQVFCSARTLNTLAAQGGTVSVFVETHVREDHIHLYGFADQFEQEWFKLLTMVQGVGAKVALALLSVTTPEALAQAVAATDKAAITQAAGIGPKLATRIISELKDKMGGVVLGSGAHAVRGIHEPGLAEEVGANQVTVDAVSALVRLGYGRSEAYVAVAQVAQRLGRDANIEALIKDSLVELSAFEVRG